MSRFLYLLRHAKSSWDDPIIKDHERPLSPRGRRAALSLARHFRTTEISPQLVLCSSAARCLQTLAPISEAMNLQDGTQVESGLYGATSEQLLARLRTVDNEVMSVLVIAHNPGLEDLVLQLAGDDPDIIDQLDAKFPTGALAEVVCDCDAWSELTGETAHVASLTLPRNLPK